MDEITLTDEQERVFEAVNMRYEEALLHDDMALCADTDILADYAEVAPTCIEQLLAELCEDPIELVTCMGWGIYIPAEREEEYTERAA